MISKKDELFELDELTSGAKPRRQSKVEITGRDLSSVGVQDRQKPRWQTTGPLKEKLGMTIS